MAKPKRRAKDDPARRKKKKVVAVKKQTVKKPKPKKQNRHPSAAKKNSKEIGVRGKRKEKVAPKKSAKKLPQVAKKSAAKKVSRAKKRSIAAKKGWETRRRKIRSEAAKKGHINRRLRKEGVLLGIPERPNIPELSEIVYGPITEYEDRVEVIRKLNEKHPKDYTLAERGFWMGYQKPDGTVAKYFSQLRWHPDKDEIRERLMNLGASPWSLEFEEEAYELADDYDVGLSEVYTLFFSP